MSSRSNSNTPSTFCEAAKVRLVSQGRRPESTFTLAYVAVSSRIYWKVAKGDGSDKPKSLIGFRKANSLKLTRSDVDRKVHADENELSISVSGMLYGFEQRRTPFHSRDVKLDIIAHTQAHYSLLLNQIHACIVPWVLFPELVESLSTYEPPAYRTKERGNDNLETVQDKIDKLDIADEFTTHLPRLVAAGAKLTEYVARNMADVVANSEEGLQSAINFAGVAADVSTIVPGASAAFHLVKSGVQIALMCKEAKRGLRILPETLCKMQLLFCYTLKSMKEIIKPSRNPDGLDKALVFGTLEDLMSTMETAERQLLRGWASRIVNYKDVKKVEDKTVYLFHNVVNMRNTEITKKLMERVKKSDEKVKESEKKVERLCEELKEAQKEIQHLTSEKELLRKDAKRTNQVLNELDRRIKEIEGGIT